MCISNNIGIVFRIKSAYGQARFTLQSFGPNHSKLFSGKQYGSLTIKTGGLASFRAVGRVNVFDVCVYIFLPAYLPCWCSNRLSGLMLFWTKEFRAGMSRAWQSKAFQCIHVLQLIHLHKVIPDPGFQCVFLIYTNMQTKSYFSIHICLLFCVCVVINGWPPLFPSLNLF